MSFLDHPGPRWFTIPAHRPFLADLAAGVRRALSEAGPEAAHDAVLLLPTRRAAGALAQIFAETGDGRAVLLPQIRAIGDLEEDEPPFEAGDLSLDLPPAISPHRRRFELARLAAEHEDLLEAKLEPAAALAYGDALGAFLDGLQLEEKQHLAFDRLDDLVEADFAEHWRRSSRFLKVALEAWPKRLADLGLIDVAERRVRLLRALAEACTARPPQGLVVAAGSTGTTPANAAVLAAVARAPQGAVVLPGLDFELSDEAWKDVEEQHPQGAMKRLLEGAGVARAAVRLWPISGHPTEGRWRRRVINEALRPAERTSDWLEVIANLRKEDAGAVAKGLDGLSVLAARNEEACADLAALLLRETLELEPTPEGRLRTAALITPDQALARRVSARLSRWGVTVDSTAGSPLAGKAPGVLAGLAARLAADPADPVALLGLLKHPFVRLGRTNGDLAFARDTLERQALRGPRLKDWAAVAAKLPPGEGEEDTAALQAARALVAGVEAALRPAFAPFDDGVASVAEAAEGLARALEHLCTDEQGATGALWAGPVGEALARVFAGLIDESEGLPPVTPFGFAELLDRLLNDETVRSGGAVHPRLQILGAIEARLISADRLILAGLEEGVWPRAASTDPFLSRPMREKLGLPPPERRLGLSAHDFAQAAAAREVVLLHCERRDNAPAVPSRWLWRLKTLAQGAGAELKGRPDVEAWSKALDTSTGDPPLLLRPARRPAPSPPVEARPKALSVTRIEKLVRDPYAIYAESILRLKALDRPGCGIDARHRGSAIHKAVERLALGWESTAPDQAGDLFIDAYVHELTTQGAPQAELARELPLARRMAEWLVAFETRRRSSTSAVAVERRGVLTITTARGEFTVSATADRLEAVDGVVHVLDFKTGSAPSGRQVRAGFSPQLTLTGAIIEAGGYSDLGVKTGDLTYVRLSGRSPAAETREATQYKREPLDVPRFVAEAREGVETLVRRYESPTTAYRSRIAPAFVKEYASDYDHLARVREWSLMDDEADAE